MQKCLQNSNKQAQNKINNSKTDKSHELSTAQYLLMFLPLLIDAIILLKPKNQFILTRIFLFS